MPQPDAPDPPADARDDGAPGKTAEPAASDAEPAGTTGRRWPFPRLTAAVLVGTLGFTLAVQIRSHDDDSLDSARTEDLVRILADLESQRTRLTDEIAELRQDRDDLASGSEGSQAALERAEELADSVGILAGTLPASGPGLELTFTPGDDPIRAVVMLDAVQELRGAGAEAMQLSGEDDSRVRVVAGTYFAEEGSNLLVDGVTLSPSYRLTVIGDPDTMSTALNIPGGVVDTVRKDGGTVIVRQPGTVDVTALAEPTEPSHAEPVN
ncbi:MAG: DUF881 domain-containing protein [Stackebrandtia sp.]